MARDAVARDVAARDVVEEASSEGEVGVVLEGAEEVPNKVGGSGLTMLSHDWAWCGGAGGGVCLMRITDSRDGDMCGMPQASKINPKTISIHPSNHVDFLFRYVNVNAHGFLCTYLLLRLPT